MTAVPRTTPRTQMQRSSRLRQRFRQWRDWLPVGSSLPIAVWSARHHGIVTLLWLHVVGLVGFGILMGEAIGHVALEVALIVALALRGGLNPNDLKIVTAVFVFVALVLPGFLQRLRRPAAAQAAQ